MFGVKLANIIQFENRICLGIPKDSRECIISEYRLPIPVDQYALQRVLDQAAKPIMEMFSRIGRRNSGRFWTHILRRCGHGLKTDRATVFLWHDYEARAVLWQADLHLA